MKGLILKREINSESSEIEVRKEKIGRHHYLSVPNSYSNETYERNAQRFILDFIEASYNIFPDKTAEKKNIVVNDFLSANIEATIEELSEPGNLMLERPFLYGKKDRIGDTDIEEKNGFSLKKICSTEAYNGEKKIDVYQVFEDNFHEIYTYKPHFFKVGANELKRIIILGVNYRSGKVLSPVMYLDAIDNKADEKNLFDYLPINNHMQDLGKYNDLGLKIVDF